METSLDLTPTEVISRFTRSPPVNVEGLAEALGLTVIYVPLADDASGRISKDPVRGGYVVAINTFHPETRRRFTLAHEIGHFVLHRSKIGDGVLDDALYRSRLTDKVEREANVFAASILMPAPLVRQAFSAGRTAPYQLGHTFNVSPAVAEIRLKELGLA